MCYILPQNVVFSMDYSTSIDIIAQSVAFLLYCVLFTMNYSTTNCSIVLQNMVVHHKNGIQLKM